MRSSKNSLPDKTDRSRLIAERVDLDWATCSVTMNRESITINAEPRPIGDYVSGYSYTAHIKLDPKSDWTSSITLPARDWEVAQRKTPLWETVRGEDYNYAQKPWENRPPIARLVGALRQEGQIGIAKRIAEVFKLAA